MNILRSTQMKDDLITRYLSKIGRKGGKSKSAAKAEAARINGKKGGRPRKKGEHHAS
jgi:hypothetical protein